MNGQHDVNARKVRRAIKDVIDRHPRHWRAIKDLIGRHPRHWCRVVMDETTEAFVRGLSRKDLDVLEISGDKWGFHGPFRSYRSSSYPEYDICAAPVATLSWDLIIAEQVFEHVSRPDLAARHVYEMLRPNGWFLITTPFLLKFHPYPQDMYRWTEDGMRVLLETAGFKTVTTGSWGNRKCLRADMKPGMQWTNYRPWHSLKNEAQFPIVVWAFAQKSA